MVALDHRSSEPLQLQLYRAVRQAVLKGALAPGTRLPSTRQLRADLNVSRNTIQAAFDQLIAEGYLTGKQGSGTYVNATLPEHYMRVYKPAQPRLHIVKRPDMPVPLESIPSDITVGEKPKALRACLPSVEEFPLAVWERTRSRALKQEGARLLGYGLSNGYTPLREAIATYLRDGRGVRCEANQVVIVAGSQHGLDLSCSLLVNPGDPVWIEDPGYLGARFCFQRSGAFLIPVPVDREGLNIDLAPAGARPKLIYVTPSHQFPTSVTMSLSRRLQLLDYARAHNAWILEDDYDSEFRYHGRPLASLQGLDSSGRVIYIGTFSKAMFPALRLGYLVLPPMLVEAFAKARSLADCHSPLIEQAAAAAFLSEGHLQRHVRKMRNMYWERFQELREQVKRHLDGLISVEDNGSGLHTVGWLPGTYNDESAAAACDQAGVVTASLSHYALRPLERKGLVLGFAPYSPARIRWAVRQIASAFGETRSGPNSKVAPSQQ